METKKCWREVKKRCSKMAKKTLWRKINNMLKGSKNTLKECKKVLKKGEWRWKKRWRIGIKFRGKEKKKEKGNKMIAEGKKKTWKGSK